MCDPLTAAVVFAAGQQGLSFLGQRQEAKSLERAQKRNFAITRETTARQLGIAYGSNSRQLRNSRSQLAQEETEIERRFQASVSGEVARLAGKGGGGSDIAQTFALRAGEALAASRANAEIRVKTIQDEILLVQENARSTNLAALPTGVASPSILPSLLNFGQKTATAIQLDRNPG